MVLGGGNAGGGAAGGGTVTAGGSAGGGNACSCNTNSTCTGSCSCDPDCSITVACTAARVETSLPTVTSSLRAIATSGNTAYAVGDGRTVLKLDNGAWTSVSTPAVTHAYDLVQR